MIVALVIAASLFTPDVDNRYSGRDNQLKIPIPRLETAIDVDGLLDESPWASAAILTDFSQYFPVDRRPAQNQTEILVWYSASAIYFGVKAYAPPGEVHASLADRDKIEQDDFIQLYLSTFIDRREALMFAVNPFGIQQDGALVEGITPSGTNQSSAFSSRAVGRQPSDLSPDYVFDSKGRLTDYGYEIEIRIPFKTLRYPSTAKQNWGLNIIRKVQTSGHEYSWTPARRGDASFLAQSGTLEGLSGLRRGLVLELTPIVAATVEGSPSENVWHYEPIRPELGMNVRWGITSNTTLNGTLNPDFSQVEADMTQITWDPREDIFFPEKRPFFLNSLEQFATPNDLIYTRRIVAPIAAATVVGDVRGTSIAILSAIDDRATSVSHLSQPFVNIARIQRNLNSQSRLAFVYTNRLDGDNSNHVVNADMNLTFRNLYRLQLQLASSRTIRDGISTTAPLWYMAFNRNGRRFAFEYHIRGIDEDFQADAGFIRRRGIAGAVASHSVTLYGAPEAILESWTGKIVGNYLWKYQDFIAGQGALERKLWLINNVSLRGGWQAGASVVVERFGFDDQLYTDYGLLQSGPVGDKILPFVGTPQLPNFGYQFNLSTPDFPKFSSRLSWFVGKDENFYEWSSADIHYGKVEANWRPTDQLRVNFNYTLQNYTRRTDRTVVGVRKVPRLKMEYQLSRSIFVRLVGEYYSGRRDDLRDDSRTGLPIVIRNPVTGTYARALRLEDKRIRFDWLFSYRPVPGTVLFFGYGNSLADLDDAPDRRNFERLNDSFFLKASYLFRM